MRTDGLCLLYIPGGCLLTALGADKVITNNVQIAAPQCDNCSNAERAWVSGRERERKERKVGERVKEGVEGGGCAVGASFQVSNTTSGGGFKPNSPPPINTGRKRIHKLFDNHPL